MKETLIKEDNYKRLFGSKISQEVKWDRLEPFILEAQNTDLVEYLGGGLLIDLIENPSTEVNVKLLEGSVYEFTNGGKSYHEGVLKVLENLSYASYAYRGSFVDTPFSFVIKKSQDSIPVASSDLKNLYNEHRNLAKKYWKRVEYFLNQNKELYPLFIGSTKNKENPITHKGVKTKLIRQDG